MPEPHSSKHLPEGMDHGFTRQELPEKKMTQFENQAGKRLADELSEAQDRRGIFLLNAADARHCQPSWCRWKRSRSDRRCSQQQRQSAVGRPRGYTSQRHPHKLYRSATKSGLISGQASIGLYKKRGAKTIQIRGHVLAIRQGKRPHRVPDPPKHLLFARRVLRHVNFDKRRQRQMRVRALLDEQHLTGLGNGRSMLG